MDTHIRSILPGHQNDASSADKPSLAGPTYSSHPYDPTILASDSQ